MTSRQQIAVGAVVAAGLLLIRWLNMPPPPVIDPPSERDDPRVEPSAPVGPAEEAMAAVAAALGAHLVRCPLPPDAPPGVRLNLRNPVQADGTISGLADEPAGVTLMFPPPPESELLQADPAAWGVALRAAGVPLGRLRWEGASPSGVGTCVLEQPPTVEAPKAHGDGRASSPAPEADPSYEGKISELVAKLEAARATVAQIDAGEDAYSQALGPEVSGEAARLLTAWRASELAEATDQVEALERQIPFWREQQAARTD